jgi:putative aldouronate transport system substrate-binding protein
VPTAPVKAAEVLPTYAQVQGPKPDFPSIGPLYVDGFSLYPRLPVQHVWTKDPPGKGSTVNVFVSSSRPFTPTPLDQNVAWQTVNKRLNATVQLNIAAQADYTVKLATIMAGNPTDLPDIVSFQYGLSGTASLPTFLQQSMADLTPYLSGDMAGNYPFLAAIPTWAWQNIGAAYEGHLYMVPSIDARGRLQSIFFTDGEIWDNEIGVNYIPQDAQDFKRVLLQLNKPADGRWATGSFQGVAYNFAPYFTQMFGTPNGWQLDSSGKLLKDWETPQYKEAVGYVRDLVAAGVYHPDSLSIAGNSASWDVYNAGKWVVQPGNFGGTLSTELLVWQRMQPPRQLRIIPTFQAHAGDKPTYHIYTGVFAGNALKRAPQERIRELLGILDWLASPFGSDEDLLMNQGVADVDYTVDGNGQPVPTKNQLNDVVAVNWKNIVGHPAVAYAQNLPDYAKTVVDQEHSLIPQGVADPTWGAFAATATSKGVALTNTFTDGLTDVLAGRRPLGDFDQLVKDWQTGGGEQIRQEYQRAISQSA